MQLHSVATKIILALETSSMSLDDITVITDMNTIPLSRFAIKLDIIFQLLNQYNQNDSELILQPRLFGLVRQIKLDCQQWTLGEQYFEQFATIESRTTQVWSEIIKLFSQRIHDIIDGDLGSFDAKIIQTIIDIKTNEDCNKRTEFLRLVKESKIEYLLKCVAIPSYQLNDLFQDHDIMTWFSDSLSTFYGETLCTQEALNDAFRHMLTTTSFRLALRTLYPQSSSYIDEASTICFFSNLPTNIKIKTLRSLIETGKRCKTFATMLLLTEPNLFEIILSTAHRYLLEPHCQEAKQAQFIISGTFYYEMKVILTALARNEYNETSITSIRAMDFLASEQRFNSLFSIQCSNQQIKLIKDLKSLFTDLYNDSGRSSSRLSLADIASFDQATSGLLMQREEYHNPDANNFETLNYLRYFSIRYFDNQPTSAAKSSARILMTKHIVTTTWQAKERLGDLAINQQIGLQTIINSHKQYTTVQRDEDAVISEPNIIIRLNYYLRNNLHELFHLLNETIIPIQALVRTHNEQQVQQVLLKIKAVSGHPFKHEQPDADPRAKRANVITRSESSTSSTQTSDPSTYDFVIEHSTMDSTHQTLNAAIKKNCQIIEKAINTLYNTTLDLSYSEYKDIRNTAESVAHLKTLLTRSDTWDKAQQRIIFTLIDNISTLNKTLLNLHLSCLIGINLRTLDALTECINQNIKTPVDNAPARGGLFPWLQSNLKQQKLTADLCKDQTGHPVSPEYMTHEHILEYLFKVTNQSQTQVAILMATQLHDAIPEKHQSLRNILHTSSLAGTLLPYASLVPPNLMFWVPGKRSTTALECRQTQHESNENKTPNTLIN